MSKFSVYLKQLLDERGEPIARIAKNAGLERTSIHKALKDERVLPYTSFKQLTQYLQLTLPQVRELNQYYEMLLQGEDIFRAQEAICQLLSELSQLYFSSGGNSCFPQEERWHFPAILHGRPQVEAAIQAILQQETKEKGTQISFHLPQGCTLSNICSLFWRDGRDFQVHQLLAFLPNRFGSQTQQENLHLLRKILPLSLTSGGNYFAYYYFEDSRLLPDIAPLSYFAITPHFLITTDSRLSVAQIQDTPELIQLYQRRFDQVRSECRTLNSYSSDLGHILESYMKNTNEAGYYTIMIQPCLGRYYTRERIERQFVGYGPKREEMIELIDRRFGMLRSLKDNYYTIFSEDGLRQFAGDGIVVDLPPEFVPPLEIELRLELLKAFRQEIQEGTVTGCIADMEKLPIPPYLTLTCDPRAGLHIYAVQGFIGGAYACNLHIEESSIGDSFCQFIKSLPESRFVYPKEKTLAVLDELIEGLTRKREEAQA